MMDESPIERPIASVFPWKNTPIRRVSEGNEGNE
jgi:hypothetical protein